MSPKSIIVLVCLVGLALGDHGGGCHGGGNHHGNHHGNYHGNHHGNHHGIKGHHGKGHHGGHDNDGSHKGHGSQHGGGHQAGGFHEDQKKHEELYAVHNKRSASSKKHSEQSKHSQTSCSYEWWKSNGDGFLKTLEHIGERIKSIVKKAEHFHLDSDTKKWNIAFNEAIDAVAQMCVATGRKIDNIFPGLGSKFSDLAVAHIRIYVCLFPTNLPTKFDWQNGRTKPDICSKPEYGSVWGCRRYSGSYSSAEEIIKSHGVVNAKKQLMNIINKCTKGKGVEGFDKNIRVIMSAMLKVASNIDKIPSLKGSHEQYFVQTLGEFFVVLFGVANNVKSRYGEQYIEHFMKFFKIAFAEAGYPEVECTVPDVKKRISKCGPFDWDRVTISNNNQSSHSNDQIKENEQSSKDETSKSSSNRTNGNSKTSVRITSVASKTNRAKQTVKSSNNKNKSSSKGETSKRNESRKRRKSSLLNSRIQSHESKESTNTQSNKSEESRNSSQSEKSQKSSSSVQSRTYQKVYSYEQWWKVNNGSNLDYLKYLGKELDSVATEADEAMKCNSHKKKHSELLKRGFDVITEIVNTIGQVMGNRYPELGRKWSDFSNGYKFIVLCVYYDQPTKVNPEICKPVKGKTAAEVVKELNICNVEQQIYDILKKITKGKCLKEWLEAFDENIRENVKGIITLAKSFDKKFAIFNISGTFPPGIVKQGYSDSEANVGQTNYMAILGGVANNLECGFGHDFVDENVHLFTAVLSRLGLPVIPDKDVADIKKRVSKSGPFSWEKQQVVKNKTVKTEESSKKSNSSAEQSSYKSSKSAKTSQADSNYSSKMKQAAESKNASRKSSTNSKTEVSESKKKEEVKKEESESSKFVSSSGSSSQDSGSSASSYEEEYSY